MCSRSVAFVAFSDGKPVSTFPENALALRRQDFALGFHDRRQRPGWRAELARRFGPSLLNLPFADVFAELARIGVAELPGDLPLVLQAYPEYQSFGLQPAQRGTPGR